MITSETWTQIGSAMASFMFVWAMFRQYFPYELRSPLEKYFEKLMGMVYPYVNITIREYGTDGFRRNKAYACIERYLGVHSSKKAKRLKAEIVRDAQSVVLSIDDHEDTTDEFQGIKVWWFSRKHTPLKQSFSFYPSVDERRSYKLMFHRRHRDVIVNKYLNYVLEEGKEIEVKKRQRKLYTNNKTEGWNGYRRTLWSDIIFEHPATFDTLAMKPETKRKIIDDLITFTKSKDYYKKIGKAWKRGYLLYGPPGTGKSTMIAAMANFLEYDVYDLELTAVKDNTELRKLLIDTSSKSIVVIEDIDCSLELTGQRKKETKDEEKETKEENDPVSKKKKEIEKENNASSNVTLSGLLNFIDGLWSACGGERIIIFTTNYKEKLDPALIRRGRMDKHIEFSYCDFEAFKILANNYLDLESHDLFETIHRLLGEINMTPADVAENLMPKSMDDSPKTCLENLVVAMEEAKLEEAAKLKAAQEEKEEEEKRKAEEKEKEKEQTDAATKEEEEEAKEAKISVVEEDKSIKEAKENGDLNKD